MSGQKSERVTGDSIMCVMPWKEKLVVAPESKSRIQHPIIPLFVL